jgi:DNA-binding transcriptional LysR family regulator
MPSYQVSSILTFAELIAQGMGIGSLPMFLAQQRKDMRALTDEIEECQTQLWLLTHTETRHLRRVCAVYGHLSQALQLN